MTQEDPAQPDPKLPEMANLFEFLPKPSSVPGGGYPGAGGPQPQIDPAVAQWFRAVDQDNSGHIDAKELGQVWRIVLVLFSPEPIPHFRPWQMVICQCSARKLVE